MTVTVFNAGKDQMSHWTFDVYRWMLVTAVYVVDPDDDYVADVVADEITGAGTETSVAAILYKFGTNDADSILIAYYPLAPNTQSFAGYARTTAATKTRTVDDTNDRIWYDCADPTFGGTQTVVLDATNGVGQYI